MHRDRFADIGETANTDTATIGSGHGSQERNAFPGVVGSPPGRVVAVVSREHQEITTPDAGEDLRDAAVEARKRPGISLGIPTMAETGIEFDEIGENETAVRDGPCQFDQTIHPFHVVTPIVCERNSASSENVVDLAYRVRLSAGRGHPIQQRRFGSTVRIVAPVRCSEKSSFHVAGERPGNDTPDFHSVHDIRDFFAKAVQAAQTKSLFVGGNLEYAVSRSVTDRPRRSKMFGPEFLDDLGTGRMAVGESSVRPAGPGNRLQQPFGKCRDRSREHVPTPGKRYAREFPMAGQRVLAW